MASMFGRASTFNQDIGSWNVAQVTDMSSMFQEASVFNQDIGSWNVAQVTDMSDMFYGASAFNQNLNKWNVSEVTGVVNIFEGANSFEQKNAASWDLSNVKNAIYRWDDEEADSGKTINWSKEPEILLSHLERWSKYFYPVFIFHWSFLILFPLFLGNDGTCSSGFENISWLYGVFFVYLIAIQFFEFLYIWPNEEGKRWLKSRSKCFLKCIRVPYWQLPACADIFTAALSRADLFTDIGFISLVSRCGEKTIYIVSLVCFTIGVVGLQFFVPLIWVIYTMFSGSKEESSRDNVKKSMKLLNVSARSMDMMLISKMMRSMLVFDYEEKGFGNVYSVASSGNVIDLIFSLIRFLFEDLIQAILQVIYLSSQPDDLSTPSNIFVIISITIAVILSAIRTIVACANPKHRKRCIRELKCC